MKKTVLFLVLACLLATAGGRADALVSKLADDEVKVKKFRIHLVTGGAINTDSYEFEKGKIKITLPGNQGTIRLDRSEVKKIEEVEDGEPVKKVFSPPEAPAPSKDNAQGMPGLDGGTRPDRHVRPGEGQPPEETDMNGNTRDWWREKVEFWKKKLADAEKRYNKASEDWNKYNSLASTSAAADTDPAHPSTSAFAVTQYEDLRGAARVEMDKASDDMEEAKKMLEAGLPDEARKAGAPPGWVR